MIVKNGLSNLVTEAIKSVYDPELPINVVDLGLIYKVEEQAFGKILIDMTLTAPNCPVADSLPEQVKVTAERVCGVSGVEITLVWEPPWTKEKMTSDGKMLMMLLGFD